MPRRISVSGGFHWCGHVVYVVKSRLKLYRVWMAVRMRKEKVDTRTCGAVDETTQKPDI